ncbi:MAG TPA: metal-dependent hydrolase [Candidatus Limnocylindria bacterium]|nr:metal-dependent hydrolase [Candidatus Limnocylindria bacterium]
MATVGHIAAGMAISSGSGYLRDRLVLVTFTICAVAPDVDFLIGIPHRTLTHSIGFAALLGVAVGLLMLGLQRARPVFVGLLAFVSVASHLVLDILTAPAPIPALWPLSNAEFELEHPIIPAAPPIPELFTSRGIREAVLEILWSSTVIVAAIWLDRLWQRRREEG